MCVRFFSIGVLFISFLSQCYGATINTLEVRCDNDSVTQHESKNDINKIKLGGCIISIENSVRDESIKEIGNQRRCILSKIFPFKSCPPLGNRLPSLLKPLLPWGNIHVPCPPHNHNNPNKYPSRRPPRFTKRPGRLTRKPPIPEYEENDTNEQEHDNSENSNQSESEEQTKPTRRPPRKTTKSVSESESDEETKPTRRPKRNKTRGTTKSISESESEEENTLTRRPPKKEPRKTTKSSVDININNEANNENHIDVLSSSVEINIGNEANNGNIIDVEKSPKSSININVDNHAKNENKINVGNRGKNKQKSQ